MNSLPITFERGERYQEQGRVNAQDVIMALRMKKNGEPHFITAPNDFAGKVIQFSFPNLFQHCNKVILQGIKKDLTNKGLEMDPSSERKLAKEGLSVQAVREIYQNAPITMSDEEKDMVLISRKHNTELQKPS